MNKHNKISRIKKSPFGGFRRLTPSLWGRVGVGLFLLFWTGCKEEGRIDYIDKNAPAPAQVTDVKVRDTHGGAVLKYKVPKDDNLLYVRAEYEIKPGVKREVKTSYFADSLILDGFGEAREYDVRLYSVGRNEKTSEPVPVTVNPLTAPIHLATKQLKAYFGGVSVKIENPQKANLAVVLMGDTAQNGAQSYLHTFYTSAEKVSLTYRGLDTVPRNYSVFLRDRWSHMSDTVAAMLTPWPEILIPKNTWAEYNLPTDSWQPLSGYEYCTVSKIWDGSASTQYNIFLGNDRPHPQWITWDLGVTYIVSRFKFWHYQGNAPYEYRASNIKKFEVYGSLKPDDDGSWDSWIPLGEFEVVIPSGQETATAEDLTFARAGFDFELEENEFASDPFVPIRYIRFKTLSVWSGLSSSTVYFGEITFWGQKAK